MEFQFKGYNSTLTISVLIINYSKFSNVLKLPTVISSTFKQHSQALPISEMQSSTLHFSTCCIFDIGAEIVTNSIFLDFSLLLFTVSGLNTFQE